MQRGRRPSSLLAEPGVMAPGAKGLFPIRSRSLAHAPRVLFRGNRQLLGLRPRPLVRVGCGSDSCRLPCPGMVVGMIRLPAGRVLPLLRVVFRKERAMSNSRPRQIFLWLRLLHLLQVLQQGEFFLLLLRSSPGAVRRDERVLAGGVRRWGAAEHDHKAGMVIIIE